MIVSKSSLKIVELTTTDKAISVLNNIHITHDGTLVAANGKAVIAVSPVNEELKKKLPIKESKKHKPATIESSTIKEVIRNMPRDTMFQGLLEFCDFNDGNFTLSDGKRKKKIESKLYSRAYIEFRKLFKKISPFNSKHRIVLNRKRLIKLLQVIDNACPDSSGESPVYIDFTEDNGMVLKAVNYKNGQRCIGIMNSYKGVEGNWLEPNVWEKKLCITKKPIRKG